MDDKTRKSKMVKSIKVVKKILKIKKNMVAKKKISIGRHTATAGRFNGLIDEVRIYNRVLSAEEIKQNMYSSRIYKMQRGIND